MHRALASVVLALTVVVPVAAQTTAPASAPVPPVISGQLFGSYHYLSPTSSAQFPNQANNAFVIDRASVHFRVALADRLGARVTTDIYPSTEATPNAYTVRAKFAYLQYDAPKQADGGEFNARIGLVQNVVIEHHDSFFPRYLSQSSVERALFFSVADAGIAAQYVLPRKAGEVYATIVNGPGYATRERDRFKDFALRVSLTPLANRDVGALAKSLTLTAWGYKGATASAFVNGGAGQVAPVGVALDRSRAGIFAAVRDPRLTMGAEVAQRHEGGDLGDNTTEAPRTPTEVTARLISAFAVVRPLAFQAADGKSPWGLVARYDYLWPAASTAGFPQPPPTSNAYHTLIAGVFADLSPRSQVALDYQEQLTSKGTSTPPNATKGYYFHFVVNF